MTKFSPNLLEGGLQDHEYITYSVLQDVFKSMILFEEDKYCKGKYAVVWYGDVRSLRERSIEYVWRLVTFSSFLS